jgi:hypothetical protein
MPQSWQPMAAEHGEAQGQGFVGVVGHGCRTAFEGRHGSMKPEGRRRCKTMVGGYGNGLAVQSR